MSSVSAAGVVSVGTTVSATVQPAIYLLAYGRLYSNHGAMTPGVDGETVDGMSQTKIARIIDALRHERYRFTPVKRVYIPKKNGKMRPLGLPSWSDKLVGRTPVAGWEGWWCAESPRLCSRALAEQQPRLIVVVRCAIRKQVASGGPASAIILPFTCSRGGIPASRRRPAGR